MSKKAGQGFYLVYTYYPVSMPLDIDGVIDVDEKAIAGESKEKTLEREREKMLQAAVIAAHEILLQRLAPLRSQDPDIKLELSRKGITFPLFNLAILSELESKVKALPGVASMDRVG